MSDILQKICADTRAHVDRMKRETSLATLDASARQQPAPRGFTAALERKIATDEIGFITEIKKASPSAGLLRAHFHPAALAQSYERAGAACLSVLTDVPYFQGKNQDLIDARAACALPVLRKDFMIDVWQVAESRAIGADCILLIMAALDDAMARDLHAAATTYGMDVLIETHDRAELDRALTLPSGMIGINNRNLKTLKTDLATTELLAPHVPRDRLLVSESGIASGADIRRICAHKVHAFLIGESLLKEGDNGENLAKLRSSALETTI